MRRMILSLVFMAALCCLAQADTLYLNNGSVLQGNFLRYENGQVYFQLTTGGDRDRGKVLRFPIKDVSRIVTDRDPDGILSRTTATPTRPTNTPNPVFDTLPTFDVRLANDWVNSNIQVTQGQKIRIEASGQITLDGRDNSSPSGIGRRDANAPLPDENDGALVASITNDLSAPVILIGKSREFVADRDGILFFTVNHWDTTNARGSYQVRVQTERRGGIVPNNPIARGAFACSNLPVRFTESENGFTGIWTRRGMTGDYDAVWTKGRQQVTAQLQIRTQGNQIFIKRISSSDGYACEYQGTVAQDGISITGTVSCGTGQFTFQATAQCDR